MAYDSIFGYVPPASVRQPQTAYAPGGAAPAAAPSPAMAYTAPAAAPVAALAPVGPSVTPPATTPTAAPTITPVSGAASIAYGGLQAGAPAAASYDTKSAVISTLGAGAAGAAQGALVGSVVPGIGTGLGAAVGGGIGLVTGGLNAYLSVGKENKNKSDRNKLLAEAERKQAARDKLARSDALSQQAYDRKQTELQKKWAKNLQVRGAIKELVDSGTVERDRYVKTGRI